MAIGNEPLELHVVRCVPHASATLDPLLHFAPDAAMTERSVFLAALDFADAADRATYLNQACAADAELRLEARQHERASQRARADGAEQKSVHAGASSDLVPGDERQQGPV